MISMQCAARCQLSLFSVVCFIFFFPFCFVLINIIIIIVGLSSYANSQFAFRMQRAFLEPNRTDRSIVRRTTDRETDRLTEWQICQLVTLLLILCIRLGGDGVGFVEGVSRGGLGSPKVPRKLRQTKPTTTSPDCGMWTLSSYSICTQVRYTI